MAKNFYFNKQSLARQALVRVVLRITVIIIVATGVSYWHMQSTLRSSVIHNLSNYVDLRSKAESGQFLLAERQSTMLRDEFLRRLQAMGDYDPKAEFDRIFVREADGLVRVRPEINDYRHHATAYLRHDVQLTSDLRRRFYIGWQLLDQWGPMLVNRFFSAFMNMPEQLSINFCPTADWARSATRETDITIYETVWRSTIEKNPKRLPFWTSVYYDPGAMAWMVSRVTPGDYQGRWVVTGGQDVEIGDLIRRTTASQIEEGTWNFIVDNKSNLIAHPNLTDQIVKAGGNLQVSTLGDTNLEAMVKAVLSLDNDAANTIEQPGLDVFLGVSRIKGPGWFFVTVYPRKLLTDQALLTARIFFAVGFALLIMEVVIMANILRRRVAVPIALTVSATERISNGDFSVRLDHQRNDELGLLAESINRMAEAIGERDAELVRQFKELQESKRIQQEQQKLEAIGILAGGIAHDFNNLLQGVFGFISVAKMRIDEKQKCLSMLEQAEKGLRMSVKLTKQLLTFSKGGKPVRQRIELGQVIRNSVKFALSGSRVDYRLEIDDALWMADADEGQISQVIHNIVLNAEQAMPMGGTVTIKANNVSASQKEIPRELPHGNYICIAISDNGTGITEENLSRIFNLYFTTKDDGSGLGLATSYSIIKNHGGVIDVKSEVGKGSTFFLWLPAIEKKEQKTGTASVSVQRTRKCRILVMDDEELIRNSSGEMIRLLGHDVEFALDGAEAIAMYRKSILSDRKFDIVILDLTIRGGMGGPEVIKALLAIDPDIKAVVSSGYADSSAISEYRTLGFRTFLTKPYTIDVLRDTLNRLMD